MGLEMVSKCCGDTFDEVDIIEDWNETNICSECGNYCQVINQQDYYDIMKDDRAEDAADDERS